MHDIKNIEDMQLIALIMTGFTRKNCLIFTKKENAMRNMRLILRWHGYNDPVPLKYYAQIPNIYGVVTSLYRMPLGAVWDEKVIQDLVREVESYHLKLEIVDSFRIHEDIKRGYDTRDALIDNYKENIRMLAANGIKVICYNFMPVFDWTRTNLSYILPDGSDCLAFEASKIKKIDARKGINLPGWGTNYRPEELQNLLKSYETITEDTLWENFKYFLDAIIPTAEECGVKMALHPDDPPRTIFGLPRIVKNADDYRRIIHHIDSPSNCITFCCGSFGSDPDNDIPAMIREFGREKIPFVHFRNIRRMEDGSFYESGHVTESGSNDMGEVMRALYDIEFDGYLRPDHGRRIWDEAWGNCNITLPDGTCVTERRADGYGGEKPAAGYGLFDRALGAAYALGLWEGIDKEKRFGVK